MCKFKLFSIAAAALMMVACSNEDLTQQTQTKAGKMQFSATIAAPSSGATTRTIYTEDTQNKKITVAWEVDDEIALVHNGVKDVATVKTINSDGSATIAGYVTGATNNADVRLVYPAARVGTVTGGADGTEYTADETVEGKLKTQDGTLAYIQDNLDFREDIGQLAVSETGVTLAEKAGDISPLLAIWKLTLSDGTNNLSATQVKIKGGESVLASTTTLATATSVVTLAIPTDVYIDGALTIEATVGDDTYAYTKAEGATFNSGTYYQSTVTMAKIVNLSTVTTATTIKNGYTVTGTLGANVKISIADGATVTLDGVTITGEKNSRYTWAGITCEGDAIIILKDGTENTVNGFDKYYPGIHVPSEMTLTIKGETAGTGKLTASSNGNGAGIGGGYNSINCGNIVIEGGVITANGGGSAAGIGSGSSTTCSSITISGGTITANGGEYAAGIGSGDSGSCGDILISGGTVSATGGSSGAGIGSGCDGSCGSIEITTDVTQVTATKVSGFETVGRGGNGSCTSVSIGGTVYWDGSNYQNGGEPYLLKSTIVYPSPLANVTSADLGKVIGADGKIYADATAATADGTTAVAVICYVGDAGTADASSATYKGLALALTDASTDAAAWCSQTSNTCLDTQYDDETAAKGDMAGIANTDALVGHGSHTHAAASAARNYNSGTHPTGTSAWFLPSAGQWEKMIAAASDYSALITRASLKSDDNYWSSSELSSYFAWRYDGIYGSGWGQESKDISRYVRSCLAF